MVNVKNKNIYLPVLAVVCTFLVCIGLRLYLVPQYFSVEMNFSDDNPLLTTPDAYYYLRLANEVSSNTYKSASKLRPDARPERPPLISLLVGSLFKTPASLQKAAFYLSPILSLGIIVVLFLFGAEIKNLYFACVAGIFTALSPIWMMRTSPGYFDTDPLNLFFFWLIIYCCWKLISTRQVAVWGSCLALSVFIFNLWWPQAAFAYSLLAILCCFPALLISSQNKIRLIFIAGLILAVFAVLYSFKFFPAVFYAAVHSTVQHILFLLGWKTTLFLPTAPTVTELMHVSLYEMGIDACGHLYVLIAAAAGLLLFVKRNPSLGLCFVVPAVVIAVMTFFLGARFLMFLVPALGIGVSWLCSEIFDRLKSRPKVLYPAVLVSLIILFLPAVQSAANYQLTATFDRNKVLLAKALKRESTSEALVWSLWGPAYFLQHYSHRRTFVDGGEQSSELVYIISVALSSANTEFSANWMKFFAKHGDVLPELERDLGSKAAAIHFLKTVLPDKNIAKKKLKQFSLPHDRDWLKWLFPEHAEVFLYLSSDSLIRSSWLSQGLLDVNSGKIPSYSSIYATPTDDVKINRKEGKILIGNRELSNSKVYYITPTELSHDVYRKVGPVTLLIKGSPVIFTISERAFSALAFQLLFVNPTNIPGYKMIVFNPYVGGVWKVL